jgi:hypothetical protein
VTGGLLLREDELSQGLHDRIAVLPEGANSETTTAQQDHGNDGNNKRGVVLFWLGDRGHLVVHDFSPIVK